MRILLAALCGFALDLLLGDPRRLAAMHPAVLMGRFIDAGERRLRARFSQTPRGEFCAGLVLAVSLPLGTLLLSWGLIVLLDRLWAPAGLLLRILWCWQALALKDLRVESLRVYTALTEQGLEPARRALSMIVGRDTEALDRAGVLRGAVETIAENFSDGVLSPLCYMLLGGAPLALCFKAVSTMDSMIGYRSERYLYFGRAAARLDDAANFLPARLGALLLIAAAGLCGEDARSALRIWRRDRRRHRSPNAAQCESAMAGALGLRLSGPARYFGRMTEKPYIGDARREIEPGDILRAHRLLYAGSLLGLLLLAALRLLLVLAL